MNRNTLSEEELELVNRRKQAFELRVDSLRGSLRSIIEEPGALSLNESNLEDDEELLETSNESLSDSQVELTRGKRRKIKPPKSVKKTKKQQPIREEDLEREVAEEEPEPIEVDQPGFIQDPDYDPDEEPEVVEMAQQGYLEWNRRMDILSYGQWISVHDLMRFVRGAEGRQFSVHEARNAMRTEWATFNRNAPFSKTQRFAAQGYFVNLDQGAWTRLALQLVSSLDFREDNVGRVKTNGDNKTPVDDVNRRCDDASLSFRNACQQIRTAMSDGYSAMSREDFERIYGLTWGDLPPRA